MAHKGRPSHLDHEGWRTRADPHTSTLRHGAQGQTLTPRPRGMSHTLVKWSKSGQKKWSKTGRPLAPRPRGMAHKGRPSHLDQEGWRTRVDPHTSTKGHGADGRNHGHLGTKKPQFDRKVNFYYIFRTDGREGGRGEDRARGGCTLREVKGFSPNNPVIIR